MKHLQSNHYFGVIFGWFFGVTVGYGAVPIAPENPRWSEGQIVMQSALQATAPGAPSLPLLDGASNWDAVSSAAASLWNPHQAAFNRTMTIVPTMSGVIATGDGMNTVAFTEQVMGQAFDSGTLAVALVMWINLPGGESAIQEGDVYVQRTLPAAIASGWNSFRGSRTVSNSALDLRRVLLHEFGHVMGLGHPDEEGQSVASIMNATYSDAVDDLRADDRTGIQSVYTGLFQAMDTEEIFEALLLKVKRVVIQDLRSGKQLVRIRGLMENSELATWLVARRAGGGQNGALAQKRVGGPQWSLRIKVSQTVQRIRISALDAAGSVLASRLVRVTAK